MEPLDPIVELEMQLLLEAIHRHYGYDLRNYAPDTLRRRLRVALLQSGASNYGELLHRVLTDPQCFTEVLDTVTVRVSTMFRDPEFYRAVREHVVPRLRTYARASIWHAGCGAGEEVYAMAILLHEAGLLPRVQLYATDISADAVRQAKEGVYPLEQLANFAENYAAAGGDGRFHDYCHTAYDRVGMRSWLRDSVVFFQHNLVSDHVLGDMQVILCRNVLIYFDDVLKTQVLTKLAGGLCPGGFLCLGMSETLGADVRPWFEETSLPHRIYTRNRRGIDSPQPNQGGPA